MNGWVVVVAVPVAALFALLVHDFMAGLGEDRLWRDPLLDDNEGFQNRGVGARRRRSERVSSHSISRLADTPEDDAFLLPETREVWPA